MRCIDIEKQHNFFTEHSVKCKCGHSILVSNKYGRVPCKWCGRFVFATKELELKYRNKEALLKYKREREKK